MNDKNKVMILAALGVVMVGVGAFSFMGGGTPAPEPTATTKKDKPAKNTNFEGEGTAPTTTEGTATEGSTAEVDPNTGQPVVDPNATGNAVANGPADVSVLVDPEAVKVSRLPQRDPFNGSRWDPMLDVKPVTQGDPPRPKPQPTIRRPSPPRLQGGGFVPMSPGPGDIGLPGIGGTGGGNAMPHVEDVQYKVNGIVRGANPAAVITDGSGKQRIVKVGSQLDPDTQVVGVENGRMILRHRGKIKSVSIDDAGASNKDGGNKPPQNQ
jgi:hypothetical protein